MPGPQYESLGVTVELDAATILKARTELDGIKGGLDKAMKGAVTKTLAKTKTMIIDQLATVLTAKKSAIRRTPGGTERIFTTPVYAGSGSVRIMGRRIGAINFDWRRGPGGVTVTYFRRGGKALFEGRRVFVGTGRPNDRGEGGNRQLFERLVKSPRRRVQNPHHLPNKGKLRQRIGVVAGLSLFDVYKGKSRWSKDVESFMREDVKAQLLSQTDRLLGRSKTERK